MNVFSVTAVFVTYGARSQLLAESVGGAVTAGVDRVIVIANGYSAADGIELQRLLYRQNCDVHVQCLSTNLGSAAGFSTGIQTALRDGAEFLWLLDDDNVAEPTALVEIRKVLSSSLTDQGDLSNLAWVSYRSARAYQRRLVDGDEFRAFPARSSFLYFDLVQRLRGSRVAPSVQASSTSPIPIPYGPYGGLFAHRATFLELGLPVGALALYEDDTEYTNRLVRRGGSLYLLPASRLRDSADNWLAGGVATRAPTRMLDTASAVRVYYSVRNRVYFERRFWRRSKFRYLVNKLTYLVVLGASSWRPRRWRRLGLILRAVSDGERGRLGLRPDLPLS